MRMWICLMVLGVAATVVAEIPAPTYALPFETAYNQDVGTARNMVWNSAFSTLGTHFELVASPLGKAMRGWGEGPYVYDDKNTPGSQRFDYGWNWTLNLRVKTVNKEKGVIMSLGRCAHGVNPGLVITTAGANGIALKVVKNKTTIMDSCVVEVPNADAAYHNYTLVFTYDKSTQHGEIKAYADGVYKASVANTVAPYYTGAQGIQLFGQYGGRADGVCTYGSKTAPESSIEDFRFWRDTVFTDAQIAELQEQYKLPAYSGMPYYHWTFDGSLNAQAGQATLNFSNAMQHTLKDGAIEGKAEGPFWLNCFNLSGSWTWLMRLKTVNAAKSCVCSLGSCKESKDSGLMVVTDGANGIKLLDMRGGQSASAGSLTVHVNNATTEFHDYAIVWTRGSSTISVFVDGVHQGDLPFTTGQFHATSTVQLFGQCYGRGNLCTYDTPGSQIADLKFYRHDGRALTWNGTALMPNWHQNAGNANWIDTAAGDSTFFSDGAASVIFNDSAVQTDVRLTGNVTATDVTVDNSSKDYVFDGAYALSGTGPFIKRGTGTVTWGQVGLLQRAVIDIQAGVLKMNTAVANMFGTSGEVTVRDGAQFDLHNVGGKGVASPVVAKTFRVAGAGPDGNGVIVNSGNNNSGSHLGNVILEGDATIGGAGCIDLRETGKGIVGPDQTLTVKNTAWLDVAGGKIAVKAIDIVPGASLAYEAGSIEAETISLPAGAKLRYLATCDFAGVISGTGTVELMGGANFALDAAHLVPTLAVLDNSSTVTVAAPNPEAPLFQSIQVGAGAALTLALNGAHGFAVGDIFALTEEAVDAESIARMDVGFTGNDGIAAQLSRNGDGVMMVTVVAKSVPKDLKWSASGESGIWDRGATANWSNLLNGGAASSFANGDNVAFNDGGAPEVELAANVNPSRIVFDSAQDYAVKGGYIVSSSDGIVKTGTGTLTWGDAPVAASTPIVVSNGVMKLATSAADIFGASGEITVVDGGQFDLNLQMASGATSPVVNKTFRIEGEGPDGQGAIVNTGNSNFGSHLGEVILTGDATIGGAGRLDFRTKGKGVSGAGKTLTVKSGALCQVVGSRIEVGTMKIADGGLFQFEPGYVFVADEIVLTNGECRAYHDSTSGSNSLPEVPIRVQGDSTIHAIQGNYRLKGPVTVEAGATLHLTCYTNGQRGLDSEKPFDNYGTVSHESGFWGYRGLINHPGSMVIHDSEDTGGVKSYSAITNNGVIWVKKTSTGGSQKINYADCNVYGNGDFLITGGHLRMSGDKLLDFTGRLRYGGGTLALAARGGGATVLAGAPWQFVVEPEAEYSLALSVPEDIRPQELPLIVGRKVDAQGKFILEVAMTEERKSGKWKLTNTGDYTAADIANWQVEFQGVEGQIGKIYVANGNVYLLFGRNEFAIYVR